MPHVSVVMPVYNGERFLAQAVESILTQTYHDFDLIIVDDGSTDSTPNILAKYAKADTRVKLLRHASNLGIVSALNGGCKFSKSPYIARMDADDISLPTRLENQVQYMMQFPQIGILGTWVRCFRETRFGLRISRVVRYPTQPNLVDWHLTFMNCLYHSSVMMRREVIEQLGFYSSQQAHVEDYELWTRASYITGLANLPIIGLEYREGENSITSRNTPTQQSNGITIAQHNLKQKLHYDISDDTIAVLRLFNVREYSVNLLTLQSAVEVIHKLRFYYLKRSSLSRREISKINLDAATRLALLAARASKFNLSYTFAIILQAIWLHPAAPFSLALWIISKIKQTLYFIILK